MKLKRFLLIHFIAVLTGVFSFSCIDQSYDLEKLSGEVELFGNSLAVPIGTTTIYLDSVIGGLAGDSGALSVKDGIYVFEYAGSIDMSGLTSALGGFSLVPVNPILTSIPLYDASLAPWTPFDIPPMEYSYSGSSSMSLPDFSTDLIAVDSVDLNNCIVRFILTPEGLGGSKLKESIRIRFVPQGTVADYYDSNDQKLSEWTVNMGDTLDIELKRLRLSAGGSSLDINQEVTMDIQQSGDVTADQAIQTMMHLEMSFVNPLDYEVVYGKVDYSMTGNADPISFDALGDVLDDNDVLSFYNPQIVLTTESNLGVPIVFNLDMGTSNSATGESRSLSNASFTMIPASSPSEVRQNQFVIDKDYGTGELFKINPDQITMGYSFATDPASVLNHFVSKNTQMSMDYSMQIPLQFGSDLNFGMGSTMELSLDSIEFLEDQEDLTVALNLEIKNRIPLNLKLQLTALDADSVALFTVASGDIAAADPIDPATGFATGFTQTTTDISLSIAQINLLKRTNKMRIEFLITAGDQNSFVSIQPSDYIELAIGLQMEGGFVVNLKPEDQ
ncbi:MAG: hypothetical protein PHE04_04230 [Bacteroidales bacterium]|nr:hypothetical protein [Bacteroidales bacterium]